ncbi:hypothetical protein PHMEG_00013133 [Phytophthora megakarya]|uniref:Uncharacterized protein n=1 Tax=Phytophthora megakarya TaxID=4795 RepID=A0A225W720_9STRA|nr:hypothetical protein PHMEG_00013133 [Phytophthora megakarya]
MTAPRTRQLRKMDTKLPLVEGEISGVKINSFVFQFETYFSFKGYDIQLDDVELGRELAQCVKKSVATWNNLRQQILRKKPETLEDVIAEGFSEVELERLKENKPVTTNDKEAPGKTTKVKAGKTSNKFAKLPALLARRSVLTVTKVITAPTIAGLNILKNSQKLADNGKTKRVSNDTTDYNSKYYGLIDKLAANDVDTTDEPLNE